MTSKELRKRAKERMGFWRWHWVNFLVTIDWDFQYQNWLDRRALYHYRQIDRINKIIKNRWDK